MSTLRMDVIVVGGGASGMMAAIAAAKEGCRVCILEHKEMPGKKILATGNGRCNFTNKVQGCECYRGTTPAFVLPALKQFGASDTAAFFLSLGVLPQEKNGYYYPRTMQASAIRNALLEELSVLGVDIHCDIGIRSITKKNGIFYFETKTGIYSSKICILAAGGKASPKSGSDGSGYIYAKGFGHTCTTVLPGLVPLLSGERWLKQTAGVRAWAGVTLLARGEQIVSDIGEVQFTDYGISGIPVFQISRYAAKALDEQKDVSVSVDFLPEIEAGELFRLLNKRMNEGGRRKEAGKSLKEEWAGDDQKRKRVFVKKILSGLVNEKIADVLADTVPLEPDVLCRKIKETKISISGTKSFHQAQVTAGGICTHEICEYTMESKLVKGLYFAGEIIDIDGKCGGYNLQWAWSSGYCAGRHGAQWVKALEIKKKRKTMEKTKNHETDDTYRAAETAPQSCKRGYY